MIFAQFLHKSAISEKLIEGCGDRAIVILDGRHSARRHLDTARAVCKQRGYLAYQLWKGESFSRAKATTAVWRI